MLRTSGQRPAGGALAHKIARRLGERRALGVADLAEALAARLLGDLGVDVAGGAGHGARPHRLAARRLHRLEERGGDLARRRIAAVRGVVVKADAQREGIGIAARQQHLVTGHPPRHLRQPHGARRTARRVDREGHRQLRLACHCAGGLGQRLLERIGRVVSRLGHGSKASGATTRVRWGADRRYSGRSPGAIAAAPAAAQSACIPARGCNIRGRPGQGSECRRVDAGLSGQ